MKLSSRLGAILGTMILSCRYFCLTLLLAAICATPVRAVDYTWNDAGADWNTGGNWNPAGGPPGTTDKAIFDSLTVTNFATSLSSAMSIMGLQIINPGADISISGSELTIGTAGIDMTTATRNLTINANVVVGGVQSWAAGTQNLTLGGVVAINNALTLSSGTITLNGTNTGTGGVNVNGASVQIGNNTAFGTGTLTLTSGSISAAGGARVLTNAVTVAGNITIGGSNNLTLQTGAMALGAAGRIFTVDNSGTTTFGGIISGGLASGVSFTKAGTGTLSLTGANTFTGGVTITGGVLILTGAGAGAALGADGTNDRANTINGGTLRITTANFNPAATTENIVIGASGGTIDLVSGGGLQLDDAGQFSGTGALTLTGTGTMILNSQAFAFAPVVNLNGGTLRVSAADVLGGTNAININGGTYDLRATQTTVRPINVQGTGNGGNGAIVNLGTASTSTAAAITLTGNASFGGTGTLTFSGVIADGASDFNVTKVGTNLLVPSGANTYSGSTTISAGVLRANSGTGLPAASNLTINGGAWESSVNITRSLGTAAGEVQITGGASGFSANGAITVNLGGAGATVVWGSATFNPLALILNASTATNTLDFQNPIDLNGVNRTINSGSTTAVATISGLISGTAAGLIKTGTGIIVLGNAANSYDGVTTVSGGILRGTSGSTLPTASNLTLNGGVFETGVNFVRPLGTLGGEVQLPGGVSGFSAFGAAITVNLGGATVPIVWGSATFNPTALVLNAVTANNTLDFVHPLDLNGATRTVNVDSTTAASMATISNVISGAAALTKAGAGILNLTATNTYSLGTNINGGTVRLGSLDAIGTTGTISFGGGILQYTAVNTTDYTPRFSNAAAQAYSIDTNGENISFGTALTSTGAASFAKRGAGTLTMNAANTYAGNTSIFTGTLTSGIDNALPTTTILNLGGNSTTVANLNLATFNQTIAGLTVSQNLGPAVTGPASTITIGAGRTLTVNGNVNLGTSAASGGITNVVFTGGGNLVVSGAAATFTVGVIDTGETVNSRSTVNMTGLANFTANLGTGHFRVGDFEGENNISDSTLRLATNNTITATIFSIGEDTRDTADHTVFLGTGTNIINADNIRIGMFTNIRSSGLLRYDPANTTGTLIIRGSAGGSTAATINLVNSAGSTGSITTGSMLLAGHNADVIASTITMARRSVSTGAAIGNLTFDDGSLSITSLIMADRSGTNANNTGTATATVTLGDSVAVGTPTVTIGSITMAVNVNTANPAGSPSTATATLSISGGNVSITNTTTAINMANANIGLVTNVSTSTINLTGGNVTIAGDIIRTAASTGTENTTFTLNGATLNMSNKSIGTAAKPIGSGSGTLNFQSGTLMNLLELNGGGALNKTTAGTLIMAGTNTYTGLTNVNAGILAVNGDQTAATGAVGVASGATLRGTGTVGGAVTINSAGKIRGGNSIGTLTVNNNVSILDPGGVIETEVTTTGGAPVAPATVNSSVLRLTGPASVLNLGVNAGAAGSGAFIINLVNDGTIYSGSSGDTGDFTALVASVATGGNIQQNGTSRVNHTFTYGTDYTVTFTGFTSLDTAPSQMILFTDATGANMYLTFSPVPEPHHILLVCVAVLGLSFYVRRRLLRPAVASA